MIWHDGIVSEDGPVAFDLRDRGLLLADGLFETLLVVGGVALRRADHLNRLRQGAAVLRLPLDEATAGRAIDDLSGRMAGPAALRLTVTRGSGARGLAIPVPSHPTVFATAAPWSPQIAFREQRLGLVSIRRNDTSPLARIKSLAYLDNVLALEAATAAGYDDALMLSGRDRVASTSSANIFALFGGRLVTPPIADGVLPGTMRALVLALAPACGLAAAEASLAPAELLRAEAVFTTNSLRLMSFVTAIEGTMFGRRPAVLDRLTEALRDAIASECGAKLPGGG